MVGSGTGLFIHGSYPDPVITGKDPDMEVKIAVGLSDPDSDKCNPAYALCITNANTFTFTCNFFLEIKLTCHDLSCKTCTPECS